ncbi:MAG: hypothetical protein KatS3mg105_3107 [Gemmatales bacterium]|nr:MAG: hypothetical protein KatS3mg105_3107 [Gemmatales bacterium]
MSFLSAIRVAFSALKVNKGRSILTSLGIIIGTSAVIAMVAAGSGARRKLDDRLATVGKKPDPGSPWGRTDQGITLNSTPLTSADAEAIRKHAGHWLSGVAELQISHARVSTDTGSMQTVVVGSVPALQTVRNWKVIHGRFYNDEDIKSKAQSA